MTSDERRKARRDRRAARKRAQTLPPPVPPGVTPKPTISISPELLARARVSVRGNTADWSKIFAPAAAMKGVLPSNAVEMAADSDLVSATGWAASWFQAAVAEGVTFIGYPLLSEMATRAEYRVISETIATEMTREWIEIKATADEDQLGSAIKDLTTFVEDLGVRDAICKALTLDGFFGRAHLYLDTGDSDDADELKLSLGNGRDIISQSKVSKTKKLQAIRAIEPIWTYPTNYNSNDPLKENWYRPDAWFVMGKQIHRTRLLTLVGREVPDILKPAYSFGGLSLSQMAKPYVDNWLRTRQSVADIIHSFVVWVLRTNMSETSQAGGKGLFDRLDLFNALRDNQGVMALDKDSEEFQNIQASLSTLDALQAQTQEHMAAVSRIPLVKLTGISPAGLNASSEGEIRVFYDTIHAMQRSQIMTTVRTIMDFCQLSLWGRTDDRITFEFKPLWSLDELGKANVNKVKAETAAIYVESGVIDTEEERERVTKDPDGDYPGLDLSKEIVPPGMEEESPEHDEILGGLTDITEGREPGTTPAKAEAPEKPKVAVKRAA